MGRRVLGPATLTAVHALESSLSSADRSLLVACSGGADSSALAVAAAEVARRRGLRASALVVDHALQPDSDQVAAAALATVAAAGLSGEAVRVEVTRTGAGPEADARAARRAVLEHRAAELGATVLLGHTLDDQAETVLLGLARGSGTRSLAGMAERRGRLLRPFLGLRRALTAAVCTEAGLDPWSDPQNADPAFARVRVRTRALPALESELGPGVAEALARTARLARDDADALDQLAAEVAPGPEPSCAELAALPPAIRRRVLLHWLRASGAYDVDAGHLQAVDRLLTHWHGQRRVEVPAGSVRRVDGRLTWRPHETP